MNRKEEMRALADNIEYRYNSSKNESGSGRVMVLYHHELPVIAAALRASAAPEEGGWDSRSIAVGHVLDWLRNRPGISWQATINDIEKAVADLAVRALPSDSGKAAPVGLDKMVERGLAVRVDLIQGFSHADCHAIRDFRSDGTGPVIWHCPANPPTNYTLFQSRIVAEKFKAQLIAALAPATEDGGREELAELICEELTGEKTCTDAGNWPAPLYAQSVNKWCAEIAAKILSPSPSVGTGTDDWSERLAGRVNQLKDGGCKSISCDAVLGLIAFVRDGEGVAQPSAQSNGEAE